MPTELQNDPGIVMAAVKQNGRALQYASEEQADPEVVVVRLHDTHGMSYRSVIKGVLD